MAAFYSRVLAVRRDWASVEDYERDEVLFAGTWVARHLDLPERTVRDAIERLVKCGVLAECPAAYVRTSGTRIRTYAPGPIVEGREEWWVS